MTHSEHDPQLPGDLEPAPARSVRRATARRASRRRATARKRQGDFQASIVDFLVRHPASTVGDIAKGLSVAPGRVSAGMTLLRDTGEIEKVSHGYSNATVVAAAASSRTIASAGRT